MRSSMIRLWSGGASAKKRSSSLMRSWISTADNVVTEMGSACGFLVASQVRWERIVVIASTHSVRL